MVLRSFVMAVPHQAGRGLRVHLDGEEIVVWHRGTVFLIAFKKAPRQPRLIVTRNWLPNFASKPLAEFRARAAQLAVKQGPGAWLGSCRRLGEQAHQAKPGGARSSAPFHRPIRKLSPALKLHRCSEPLICVHDNLTTQTLPHAWRCSPCRVAGKLAKREWSSLDGICANDPNRCSCRISCRVGFFRPHGR